MSFDTFITNGTWHMAHYSESVKMLAAAVSVAEKHILLSFLSFAFLTSKDGTDRFFRNVGTELPALAAQ